MKENKAFVTIFDIMILLVIAALAVVIALFASPTGKTADIKFTVVITDNDTSDLSVGDVLVCRSGGCLGTVTGKGDGFIEVTAKAEKHKDTYYSDSVAVCDGREYEICVGADKYTGTVRRISEV